MSQSSVGCGACQTAVELINSTRLMLVSTQQGTVQIRLGLIRDIVEDVGHVPPAHVPHVF